MADRTVNGNTNTENGWRLVDTGSCVWVKVPGTNPVVSLQIREGQPAAIMGAFAADFNAYVEPLRDADSACYTESNSVLGQPGRNNGSNHMSATAMDLDWNSHPFRVLNAGFNAAQIATIRELLGDGNGNGGWYEGMIWWGNDWDNPKDAMHFQMGYNTYGSENVDRVQDFINRKIRADGFSTFRRGGAPVPPPPPPPASQADGYAVAIITEGRRRNVTPRGIQIALSVALVESNLQMYANSSVPESMSIPHDKVGTDHDSVGLFQQRCPMWGPAEVLMDPARSAGLFYDRLVKLDYNNTDRLPGDYAADVQRPAAQYRGRYQERMGDAVALYDRLSTSAPSTTGDDMASVPQDQWDRVYQELTKTFPSRSPLRHLGEGPVDTMAGFVLNTDGSQHVEIVKLLAGYGHPPTLALLREVAAADPAKYPDRQDDRLIAQAILADVTSVGKPVETVMATSAATPPQIVYVDRPVAAPVPALVEQTSNGQESTGQIIGAAYDALQKLRLADALPIEDRAPLAALISVLSTKNGASL